MSNYNYIFWKYIGISVSSLKSQLEIYLESWGEVKDWSRVEVKLFCKSHIEIKDSNEKIFINFPII